MPRPCSRTVDAPLRVVGLEWDDWVVLSSLLMFFLVVWTPAVSAIMVLPLMFGLKALKKGQPPGIVTHRLWAWGLLRFHGFLPAPGRAGSLWSPWP